MRPDSRSSERSAYSQRLVRLQTARWKRWLDVQRPYRMHLLALQPGFVLEIGCGIGRNLGHLGGHGVGVDLDAESVRYVREELGYSAYTPEQFALSPHASGATFDTLLFSHVLEHVDAASAASLVATYLPRIKPGGRVVIITPQEVGYASDATHVRFVDHAATAALAAELGLAVERQYSFPFPRAAGRVFKYNEFVSLLRVPAR